MLGAVTRISGLDDLRGVLTVANEVVGTQKGSNCYVPVVPHCSRNTGHIISRFFFSFFDFHIERVIRIRGVMLSSY